MQENILSAPLNFDNFTFRCSMLGKLMGDGVGRSPMQKYQDAIVGKDEHQEKITAMIASIKENQAKIDGTDETKREQVGYKKLLEKKPTLDAKLVELMEKKTKLDAELVELEKRKDDLYLPETCISQLVEVYASVRDGIKKDIHSKYLENGLAKEEDAIELISDVHDKFYIKNDERKRNEYIEGECDIWHEIDKIVIDMKNAWNRFTFQKRTVEKVLNKDYYWQGVGYCKLWGAKKFLLVYCLVNMPTGLIADELKRILYDYGSDKETSVEYQDACAEFVKQCNFDHLPLRERVYQVPMIYMESEYELVVERIILCRKWLNQYAIEEYNRVNGIAYIGEIEQGSELVVEKTDSPVSQNVITELPIASNIIPAEEIVAKPQKPTKQEPEILNPELNEVVTELNEEETDYEVDVEMIYATIEGIKELTELDKFREQIGEEIINSYQGVKDAFEAQETLIFANGEPVIVPIEENKDNVFEDAKQKINDCKNEADCVALYPKVKPLFIGYPILKDLITAKRETLKPKKDEPAVVQQAEEKPKKPEPASKTEKPKAEKPKAEEVKTAAEDEILAKCNECREKVSKCVNSDEIRLVIKDYEDIMKNRENKNCRELRSFINDTGNALDKKNS